MDLGNILSICRPPLAPTIEHNKVVVIMTNAGISRQLSLLQKISF
jgi:hypothetical protein